MANFNLGALAEWQPVQPGELWHVELPDTSGHRRVAFELMASEPVIVMAEQDGERWPIATGDGFISAQFTVTHPVDLIFFASPDAVLRLRTFLKSQLVRGSGEPSFTTIEPRAQTESDKMRKLLQLMHQNSMKRIEQLQRQLDTVQVRSQREAVLEDAEAAIVEAEEREAQEAKNKGKAKSKEGEVADDT